MNNSELPSRKSEKQVEQGGESLAERITIIEGQIRDEAALGNFDEVLKLSIEREEIKDDIEEQNAEQARKEALPRTIDEARTRITAIEDGSFPIPDPALRATILINIKERLATAEEDLLIAEGTKPSYEAQSAELETEIAELTEQYARRWEEIASSGDEARILAFLGGIRRDALELPDKSPYDSALWHAKTDFAMQTEYDFEPKKSRDSLLRIKKNLEETLRRSDNT